MSQGASQPTPRATADPQASQPRVFVLTHEEALTKIREANETFEPSQSDYSKNKSSWTWLFLKDGACLVCNKVITGANPTNNKSHLKQHGLDDKAEVVKTRCGTVMGNGTPTIAQAMSQTEQSIASKDYMLVFGIPPSRVESPVFQAAHPQMPKCRKHARTQLVKHAISRLREALLSLNCKTVTVAIDAGTIWHKYLAIVIIAPRCPPLTVALPCKDSGMTATWVKEQIEKVYEQSLKPVDIRPIGIVSDNGSNMISACRSLPFLETRCAIHTMQLIVHDFFKYGSIQVQGTLTRMEEVWEQLHDVMRAHDLPELAPTRWNGKYLNLKRIAESPNVQISEALLQACKSLVEGLAVMYEATVLHYDMI